MVLATVAPRRKLKTQSNRVITLRTDFAGGGLVDLGYRASGLVPVFAVEWDAAKCEVYRENLGGHIVCAAVEDVLPGKMSGRPDIYHVSPSCKNASRANSKCGEQPSDLSAARMIAHNLRMLRPSVFTLENVAEYRNFKSFGLIVATLAELGYEVQQHIVQAADYGVPQTRLRLILVATSRELPSFEWPSPTHHNGPAVILTDLFGTSFVRERWVSWHEALTNLLPSLPEADFADWQLARLPEQFTKPGLLMDSKNAGQEWGKRYRLSSEPSQTVTTLNNSGHFPKAFLSSTGSSTGAGASPKPAAYYERKVISGTSEPGKSTTTSNLSIPQISEEGRPFLVNCTHRTGSALTVREVDEPAPTITATSQRREVSSPRAWLEHGKIVKLSVEALARLQMNEFSRDYQFSGNLKLDSEIIGNGYPSQLAKRFGEQIVKLFD